MSTKTNAGTSLSTLTTDFRVKYGQEDSANSMVTNTQVRRLLLTASNDLAQMIGVVEADTAYPLGNDSAKYEYILPTRCLGVEAVDFFKNGQWNPVQFVERRALGDTTKAGRPSDNPRILQWSTWNGKLQIWPARSSYSAADSLKLAYVQQATGFDSAAATSQLPTWSDGLVVELAVFYAQQRDATIGDIGAWWGYFKDKVASTVYQYTKRRAPLVMPQGAQ